MTANAPEPAANQSSQQILLSGTQGLTTADTHGQQVIVNVANNKKRKSRRAEIENEIEEEL